MNVLKNLDILCNSASSMLYTIKMVMSQHGGESYDSSEPLTGNEWLAVAYACDAPRELFRTLPEAVQKQGDEDMREIVSNLFPHLFKIEHDDEDSNRIDLAGLKINARLLHNWAHDQYCTAREAVDLYTK